MKKHIIFDTETTGLIRNTLVDIRKQPQIFDFYGYGIDIDTFEEVDELQIWAKPTIKMEAGAKKATKKDDNFVKDFPPIGGSLQKLKEYIESAEAVVAHNAVYDFNIINMEFKRHDMKIKWPRVICTIEQTEAGYPDENGNIVFTGYRLSLTKLHEALFGEKFDGAHEAKTDVRALGRCYIELIKRGWIK